MEQSFHRLFLEALTIPEGTGEPASVTSQVGFTESEVNRFCHPQLVGPESARRAHQSTATINSLLATRTEKTHANIGQQKLYVMTGS